MEIQGAIISGIVSGVISSIIILGVTFWVSKRMRTLGSQKEMIERIKESVAELNSYYWHNASRKYGDPDNKYFNRKYLNHKDLVKRFEPDLLNREFARNVEEWDERFVEEFIKVYIKYRVSIEMQGLLKHEATKPWKDTVSKREGFLEDYYKILDGEIKKLSGWRSFLCYPRYANAER